MGTAMTFDSKLGRGRLLITRKLAVAIALAAMVATVPTADAGRELMTMGRELISVVVRENPGAAVAPEHLVEDLGGRVGRRIDIIHAFEARVPADAVDDLVTSPAIHSVTPNRKVQLLQFAPEYDPGNDLGSLYNVNRALQAPEMWKKGYTGLGVDVALIDSGVVPVEGLSAPGKVVNALDVSFESQADDLRYMDTYGHGTHMAGIIAGRDNAAEPGAYDKKEYVVGVAPDARIVNVKVADYDGATDVVQVLAALDWVVQHRNDDGMNIRVVNLSFGTDGTQSYLLDPLAYAAEVAWRKGIVVVVAAGNSGYGNAQLNNPAYDPYVIAVGASESLGTPDAADDVVPEWSSRGDGIRNPDIVAPGKSISSFRAPGSYLDETYPSALLHDRFFKGSGTSQAAAAVSGAAALLVQKHPSATPDQIKALLLSSADKLPTEFDLQSQGNGFVNLKKALEKELNPNAIQPWLPSTGLGSLEASRGSAHLSDEGVELNGEYDLFGNPWAAGTWAVDSFTGRSWSGGFWNGTELTGDCWCSTSWSGRSWSGRSWSGRSWSGRSWSSIDWSGRSWSGRSWSGRSWSGRSWSGRSWSGNTWSGAGWGP